MKDYPFTKRKGYPIGCKFRFHWIESIYDRIIKETIVFSKMSKGDFAGMPKEEFIKKIDRIRGYAKKQITKLQKGEAGWDA